MRSRSCTMEGPAGGHIQPTGGLTKQEENKPETKRKTEVQEKEKAGSQRPAETRKPTVQEKEKAGSQRPAETRKTTADLTKADMLHLLGIMEGEVQARDDIIGLLKSDRTRPEAQYAQYAQYASAGPARALQALQRDGLPTPRPSGTDHVYEKPMAELDRLEEQQKETYRRMLEQLLMAEKCHRRTVSELDTEKQKHADFMDKSDDFTNLLEQEMERLKRLLEQEKAHQARKDQDHSRRLEKLRVQLVKLKSFALTLVDERQLHVERIDQQSQEVQDLARTLQEKELRLAAAAATAEEDGQKLLALEAELGRRAAGFARDREETAAKMADDESRSRRLRLELAGLSHRIEELEESNQVLRKSEEDLRELRGKLGEGESGGSSLVTELESLRRRVLEMEGKDEEVTKAEARCRELRKRLQGEENHGRELRLEVDKLHGRTAEPEELEAAFGRSKDERSRLHANLEEGKRVAKDLAGELEAVKTRLKELERSETKFEKAEVVFRDDLTKLKSFTVILVDEGKNVAERLRREEQKSDDLSGMLKAEQGKVTEVTEKLIEESKRLLRFKSEMEVRVTTLVKEKEELKTKLVSEEEKCRKLNTKLGGMNTRIDGLEEMQRKWSVKDNDPDEDNKAKELALEIERLKSRLKQLEVVEGGRMKTEDEYDRLEKSFRTERDKANSLSEQLEETRSQIARNKAVEKGEVAGPEAELRSRCRAEEARTRELAADVRALKEKIHQLMDEEDQLSRLQADYRLLQQRLLQEEERKTSMSRDFADLAEELEATRRYGRALRPGANGKRMLGVPVASTAVQTDATASEEDEDETAAGFIRKSVLEENRLMSNLRQRGLKKKPAVLERYPPASAELGAKRSWMPWMKKKEAVTLTQTAAAETGRASSWRPPETTGPGRPLRIRVTPDHGSSTATLEITSLRAEDFFSSATIIPTLGLRKPRITIVPVASRSDAREPAGGGLDPVRSPVTITAVSRAKSPDEPDARGSDGLRSPVSVVAVGAAPEPHGVAASRAVTEATPEKQPAPFRKYNGSIVTTEDNKIHIHLGPRFQRPCEALLSGEAATTGTVLRSPRLSSTATTTRSKMTSSITITPTSARPTPAVPGSEVPARGVATTIPVSKGMKPSSEAAVGVSTVTRSESRAESHSVRIELRRSTVCGPASAGQS